MRKERLLQTQLRLVVQSDTTVMIPVGETPVLEAGASGSGSQCAVTATNFLRCGCPSVQILVHPSSMQMSHLEHFTDEMRGCLASLANPGEQFRIQLPTVDEEILYKSGAVLCLTRQVGK